MADGVQNTISVLVLKQHREKVTEAVKDLHKKLLDARTNINAVLKKELDISHSNSITYEGANVDEFVFMSDDSSCNEIQDNLCRSLSKIDPYIIVSNKYFDYMYRHVGTRLTFVYKKKLLSVFHESNMYYEVSDIENSIPSEDELDEDDDDYEDKLEEIESARDSARDQIDSLIEDTLFKSFELASKDLHSSYPTWPTDLVTVEIGSVL